MNKNFIKVLIAIFLIMIILGGALYFFDRNNTDAEQTIGDALESNQENTENEEIEERKFEEELTTPLSNSNAPAGSYVHNTFDVTSDDKIDIIEDWKEDNESGLKYRKITSYSEYLKIKEALSNIREMTKDDFINYFMVIFINQDTNYVPKFEKVECNRSEGIARILIYKKARESNDSDYNGSWVVMPNNNDKYEFSIIYSEQSINEDAIKLPSIYVSSSDKEIQSSSGSAYWSKEVDGKTISAIFDGVDPRDGIYKDNFTINNQESINIKTDYKVTSVEIQSINKDDNKNYQVQFNEKTKNITFNNTATK